MKTTTEKRTWIKVKRGILEPKHRERLGIRIWLYIHILDTADWETGTISGWTDAEHAARLEMPVRTLQDQRQRLAEDGYITCTQGFQNLTITIHNWTNPREYSGQVYNPAPHGTELSVPPEAHGTELSVPMGAESSVPLHYIHTKDSHKRKESKDASRKPRDERLDHPAAVVYRDVAHLMPAMAVRDLLLEIDDPERFRVVVQSWIGRGWNPRNVAGMVDVYKNGLKTRQDQPGKRTVFERNIEALWEVFDE